MWVGTFHKPTGIFGENDAARSTQILHAVDRFCRLIEGFAGIQRQQALPADATEAINCISKLVSSNQSAVVVVTPEGLTAMALTPFQDFTVGQLLSLANEEIGRRSAAEWEGVPSGPM
jgi:hypothetical protein